MKDDYLIYINKKGGFKMGIKSRVMSVRVEEEDLRKLDEICKTTGIKKMEIVKRALKTYLRTLEQSDVVKVLSEE